MVILQEGECMMNEIKFDFSKIKGRIKPMHAVNNGPVHKKNNQVRSNLKYYSKAGIPYARNHDASFFAGYGGEHTVDVHAIYPNFDADPYSAESYDFTLTDIYSQMIEKAGAKVFYRLGSKIEHAAKKYGTLPPKDFKKWAIICEHIIKHLTEGWADGLHLDIEYWEIWNEEDGGFWFSPRIEYVDFLKQTYNKIKSIDPNANVMMGGMVVRNGEFLKMLYQNGCKDWSRLTHCAKCAHSVVMVLRPRC